MSKWKSVEDGLPEYTDDYNVACDISTMAGGYREVRTYRYERIKGIPARWVIPERIHEVVTVTHWRDLPLLPEEEEANNRGNLGS